MNGFATLLSLAFADCLKLVNRLDTVSLLLLPGCFELVNKLDKSLTLLCAGCFELGDGLANRGRSSDLLPNMMKPTNAARKKILHNSCSVATIAKFK